ncbi:exostosin family-domain-containing protein [Ochromonadaceae sp. CCMP2298]|nr:exostosin family-domain-containing protein [Ochromonadaceae sp. CCMP2298]
MLTLLVLLSGALLLLVPGSASVPGTASGSLGSNCTSPFKIYVYDLPQAVTARAELARQKGEFHICKKCIFEQFALEYIVHDFLSQHCARTLDPTTADFFYLPIIREVDYRVALTTGGGRAPSRIEQALLGALEGADFSLWREVFNVTDKYWRRSNGSDHIIVMPAPVTNLRHQTNMRGFFHYMMQLHPPIFLNVEYSLSFVQEYPVCATSKNIVVPYPTIDPDFYSGKLFVKGFPDQPRDKLLFYQGGMHGSCTHVRQALTEVSRRKELAVQRGARKREEGFQGAVFCPIPVGDSPSSKRMYDVLSYGCIPVVLSDELVWAYTLPTGGPLLPWNFSLHLPQSAVQKSAKYVLHHLGYPGPGKGTGKGKGASPALNWGQPLPSGASLLQMLVQIAAEDEQAEAEAKVKAEDAARNSTGAGTQAMGVGAGAGVSTGARRLAGKPFNAKAKNARKNNPPGKGPPGDHGSVASNTLVRVLRKISQQDVRLLQRGVREVAPLFQYYLHSQMDTPPPAVHAQPTGGAMQLLELQLRRRWEKGLKVLHKSCVEERMRPGHTYIGRYPCEKRRRRLSLGTGANVSAFGAAADSGAASSVHSHPFDFEWECGA